jgi:hypothetical protein
MADAPRLVSSNELEGAEARRRKRLFDRAVKTAIDAIDDACRRLAGDANDERALAMSVVDWLTTAVIIGHGRQAAQCEVLANLHAHHVVTRLAQHFGSAETKQ